MGNQLSGNCCFRERFKVEIPPELAALDPPLIPAPRRTSGGSTSSSSAVRRATTAPAVDTSLAPSAAELEGARTLRNSVAQELFGRPNMTTDEFIQHVEATETAKQCDLEFEGALARLGKKHRGAAVSFVGVSAPGDEVGVMDTNAYGGDRQQLVGICGAGNGWMDSNVLLRSSVLE